MAQTSFGMGVGRYSARVAARIARIKYQNFQAWSKANLIKPEQVKVTAHTTENVYSYKDLLLIRLIVRLKTRGAQPKAIRAALDTLEYLTGTTDSWMKAIIAVQGGVVVAMLADLFGLSPIAASKGPQAGLDIIFFPELIRELKEELVPPERFPLVEVDPGVLGGAPVIKGTRVSTRAVASVRETGGDPSDAYPNLSKEQVANAERYERFLQEVA